MSKLIFKKMGFLLCLAALTGRQSVHSVHSECCEKHSSHSLSCNTISKKSTLITGAWDKFSGGLFVLFAQYGIAGINSTTTALTAAYNSGQIILQAQNFGQALIEAGVAPKIAQNVANQLKLYAFAAENYGIALNSGGDAPSALAIWNAQTDELISSLSAIPNIRFKQINALVSEYQQTQLLVIQAFAAQDFTLAMTGRIYGESLGDLIPDYLTKQLLLIHCL